MANTLMLQGIAKLLVGQLEWGRRRSTAIGTKGARRNSANHNAAAARSITLSIPARRAPKPTLSVHPPVDKEASKNRGKDGGADDDQKERNFGFPSRKLQNLCASALAATLVLLGPPDLSLSWSEGSFGWFGGSSSSLEAQAAGLLQMPPPSLSNRYFLVRAGSSYFESQGLIHTNPVSKTSVDSGLSAEGKKETVRAAIQLQQMGACNDNCWIWPSITQRSYQTAEAIAVVNNISYSRIVPEYSFLDARGLGAYENRELSALNEVYSSDLLSTAWKPPRYTDGTPNESVTDVLVRVTQLMSILETQYSGEAVIIISPDSDNLSILQAALTGQDLKNSVALVVKSGMTARSVYVKSEVPGILYAVNGIQAMCKNEDNSATPDPLQIGLVLARR